MVDRSENMRFVSEPIVLQQYQDTFRITGLRITKDQGYEAAVMGTPGETDDLYLFQLLVGMSQTFGAHLMLENQTSYRTL